MAEGVRGDDDGPNVRPLEDTVGQTGPGIPDDAASEGYDPVADAEAQHEADAAAKPKPPGEDTLFNGP